MTMKRKKIRSVLQSSLITAMLATFVLLTGCGLGDQNNVADNSGSDPQESDGSTPSNRVDIPSSVRSNLGITFVTVERRRVEQTLRVPGRFELPPTAQREYRTMLPGRVELLVEQFDAVESGDVLYRIDSPAWRELQQQLLDAEASIATLTTKEGTFAPLLAAHAEHERTLGAVIDIWRQRVDQLEEVHQTGGGRLDQLVEARASLAATGAQLAEAQEKDAQLQASKDETATALKTARVRKQLLLQTAAALVDRSAGALLEPINTGDQIAPRWRTINAIEVRAEQDGVIESFGLTNGAWADEQTVVLTVVRDDVLRFHASGLQSDLGVLRDGLDTRIVPPATTRTRRAPQLQDTMSGTLRIGLTGDPDERTFDLYVTPDALSSWARRGVTAQLEIVTDISPTPELAIPLAAVQRDGINPVIFKRDPADPNKAIRIDADLGADDGRWITVLSGIRDGDEIVLDGAFQLMLATSGSMQQGGHFHADGTFHAEDH